MQSEQRYRLATKSQYPGAVVSYTTPIPNEALDDPALSNDALKVLIVCCRSQREMLSGELATLARLHPVRVQSAVALLIEGKYIEEVKP